MVIALFGGVWGKKNAYGRFFMQSASQCARPPNRWAHMLPQPSHAPSPSQ